MVTADHLEWQASSFAVGYGCVEVARTPDGVLVRDAKDYGTGPMLELDHDEWAAFVTAALAGVPIPTVTTADAFTRHAGLALRTHWHVSSARTATPLHFTDTEWTAFLAGARAGEFGDDRQPALARS